MKRQKRATKRPTPPPAARPRGGIVFSPAVQAEADPEWRSWFQQVERLRQQRRDPKKKPFIVSTFEFEGRSLTVARRKAEPVQVKKLLATNNAKEGMKLSPDREALEALWKSTVGPDLAETTSVFALKNGTLTISVQSAALLQEIRQFHQEAIFKDLQDLWPFPMPLVKIIYKLGGK